MQTKLKTSYVIAALIPLIIILGCFILLTFNKEFYYEEISSNRLGIEDAREKTAKIVDYLKTGKAVENNLLSADETKHMEDVRGLMKKAMITLGISLALAIILAVFILIKQKKGILDSLYYGGLATAIITIVSLLILTVAFEQAFTIFHKMLFSNNLWMLPADSTLIRLFPQEFFMDFAKRAGLNSMIISILLIMVGRLKRR